jgi:hypothetical protein
MRCPNCQTLCADTDANCPKCQVGLTRPTQGAPMALVGKCSLIAMVAGQAVFHALAPRLFTPVRRGLNPDQVMWAFIIGGLCALLGAAVGMLLSRAAAEQH